MPALRRATLADLPLLVRHRRLMWEEMGIGTPASLREHDDIYRRWLRTRLRNGAVIGLVVDERGAPAATGCLWLQKIHPRPANPGRIQPYLMSMFTEPASRGRGHAARIVREAIRIARASGAARMSLHASDAGRPIYARLGFVAGREMTLALRSGRKSSPAPRHPR